MSDEVTEQVESTPEDGTIQEEVGTTARLFPDLMGSEDTSDEATPEPVKAEEKEDSPERQRDEKGRFTSEAKTEVPEYLNLEDFGDRKVKVKINGVESEVPFKDVIRGYQTDAALTQKGQRIAEEFNRLKTLKPENVQVQATAPQAATGDDDFYREYIAPHIEPYKKELDALKASIGGFEGVLAPLTYEANLKSVDSRLKTEGYNDFMAYRSKIEEHLLAMPIEMQVQYDSPQGYISIYKDLKIQDLQKQMVAPPKEEKKNPDARPKPKLVAIEGGTSIPSGADDSRATITKLKNKAYQSGRLSDYAALIEQMDNGRAG